MVQGESATALRRKPCGQVTTVIRQRAAGVPGADVGSDHGGRYTLTGSEYVEHVDFANSSTAHLVGQTFAFTVTFDGDTHRQTGVCCGGGRCGGTPFLLDSVWKRR